MPYQTRYRRHLKTDTRQRKTSRRKLSSLYTRISGTIRILEEDPIARLIAFLAAAVTFAIPLWQFYLDTPVRRAEATARAWQTLTHPAVGNSGKVGAIEFLVALSVPLTGIDLSCYAMSNGRLENGRCSNLVFLQKLKLEKEGVNLQYANLSATDLSGSLFNHTDLYRAKFEFSDLRDVQFVETPIHQSSFRFSDLTGTIFRDSVAEMGITPSFRGIDPNLFYGANITDTVFPGVGWDAHMHSSYVVSHFPISKNRVGSVIPKISKFNVPGFVCKQSFFDFTMLNQKFGSDPQVRYRKFLDKQCAPYDPALHPYFDRQADRAVFENPQSPSEISANENILLRLLQEKKDTGPSSQ